MNTRLLENFKTFNSTAIFVFSHLLQLARSYFSCGKQTVMCLFVSLQNYFVRVPVFSLFELNIAIITL